MTKLRQSLSILHCAFCIIALAALAANAITQAEWEADNSLIPSPSASSPFYVVAPSAPAPEQRIVSDTLGFDSTFTKRKYGFDFETRLSTKPIATVLLLR